MRESGVPVISVGAKTEGMGCIEFDDYHAMSQMVRHVICEHGVRKLAYIDGPKEYSDAAKRAQAYRFSFFSPSLSLIYRLGGKRCLTT